MMRRQLIAASCMLLCLTVATGIVYPAAVTLVGQIAFGDKADGSLIIHDGRTVGSALIGQSFERPGYFHGRPGAYDPSASGATNLGPSNQELIAAIGDASARVKDNEGVSVTVPADGITTSASGLDPHISVAFALLQTPRVARERGLGASELEALVNELVEERDLGFLGEPRVNVLRLNLALDRLTE